MKVIVLMKKAPCESGEILGIFATEGLASLKRDELIKKQWYNYRMDQLHIEEWNVEGEYADELIADLLDALIHLTYNAAKSGAEMGLALDVAKEAIEKAKGKQYE